MAETNKPVTAKSAKIAKELSEALTAKFPDVVFSDVIVFEFPGEVFKPHVRCKLSENDVEIEEATKRILRSLVKKYENVKNQADSGFNRK